jgi:DNA polymerase
LTLGGEKHLLGMPSDRDMHQCNAWAKAVSRDIHKMHAFVRFRLVGVNEQNGREQFVAWFEPEYRITRLAAPFFEKRFASMDWSILTPDECVSWDGEKLTFMPATTPPPPMPTTTSGAPTTAASSIPRGSKCRPCNPRCR